MDKKLEIIRELWYLNFKGEEIEQLIPSIENLLIHSPGRIKSAKEFLQYEKNQKEIINMAIDYMRSIRRSKIKIQQIS